MREEGAVGETGERVEETALAEVGERPRHPPRAPPLARGGGCRGFGADGDAAQQHPAVASLCVAQAQLALEVRALAAQVRGELLEDALTVVGVNVPDELPRGAHLLDLGEPQ